MNLSHGTTSTSTTMVLVLHNIKIEFPVELYGEHSFYFLWFKKRVLPAVFMFTYFLFFNFWIM